MLHGQSNTAGDDHRPTIVIAAPVARRRAQARRIGDAQRQRRQAKTGEDGDKFSRRGEHHPLKADTIQMFGQRQDHARAATRPGRGQIADFRDALARHRLAGQATDMLMHRMVEVGFQEQRPARGAAPTRGREDATARACRSARSVAAAFQQEQIGRETGDARVMALRKNGADEGLGFVPAG